MATSKASSPAWRPRSRTRSASRRSPATGPPPASATRTRSRRRWPRTLSPRATSAIRTTLRRMIGSLASITPSCARRPHIQSEASRACPGRDRPRHARITMSRVPLLPKAGNLTSPKRGVTTMLGLSRKSVTELVAVLVGIAGLSYLLARTAAPVAAEPPAAKAALVEFTADGKLKQPVGYRNWIYVGASVTPNDLNGGKARFPEYHAIYIDP